MLERSVSKSIMTATLGGDDRTSLDGLLSTSPMPPPFRSPWLSVVTMHMMSVSQARSLSASSSELAEALARE